MAKFQIICSASCPDNEAIVTCTSYEEAIHYHGNFCPTCGQKCYVVKTGRTNAA